MCGIFGILLGDSTRINSSIVKRVLSDLFRLSESRGTESSGIAIATDDKLYVLKEAIPASKLVKAKKYDNLLRKTSLGLKIVNGPLAIIGHSRLVTNGSQEIYYNNQPVLKDGIVGIHNGIIVNVDDLWAAHPEITRKYDIDTEVFLSLIRLHLQRGLSLSDATRATYDEIKGNASVALLFADLDYLLLATDYGSLYTYKTAQSDIRIFASEAYILQQLARLRGLSKLLGDYEVVQVRPRTGIILDINTLEEHPFLFGNKSASLPLRPYGSRQRQVIDLSSRNIPRPSVRRVSDDPSLLFEGKERIKKLRRCTKCLLPETFPFIEFDENGVCNYCRSYEPIKNFGLNRMKQILRKYRSGNDQHDCMVMLSGGRDSSFALHYVTKELGMNPVAYTYDWGMVTDIARRNIARLCGTLGVEHILVSAPIKRKRENIRKNILAWLRRPDLGMVPLFMAGDKHWYYYANEEAKRLGLDLVILSTNDLEKTHFKVGFCGIPPISEEERRNGDRKGHIKLFNYYLMQALRNPHYLNSSIFDTLTGFISFYQVPKRYLRFYEYFRWDEKLIEDTLINEYEWETDPETRTTWRIGDGTAQFYNYIYYTIAGFTENDTFRSNQIREGLITREEAMARIWEENKPRYHGIKWYLDVVGLGPAFNSIIRTINNIPKLY